MKILIEMPQEEYQKLIDGRIAVTTMRKAIRNGTVLSEAQADGGYISRQAVIDSIDKWVKNMGVLIALPAQEVAPLFDSIHELPSVTIPSAEPKVGRCEDCKCFRKLPLRTDTSIGKCVQHWGVCPPCDWYCADFEPQESEEV